MKTIILLFVFAGACLSMNGQAVKKKDFPFQTDAAVCFSIGTKIYVGGGVNNKQLWEYDPATDLWTRKADIPGVKTDRGFAVGFCIGNKGYVGLGGDSTNLVMKKDLWEYDPTNNSWTQKADYPGVSPDGCAHFVAGGKAYVVGGTDNKFLYATSYEYNPATNKWTNIASYPGGPILFGAAFSIGNYGYVTGGQGQTELTVTYRLDAATNTWEQMADFPGTPRQTAIGFSIGALGYVGGGQKGYTQVFKDFYRYNPANNTWALVGDMGNKNRAWAMATSVNGKGYFGCGFDFASFFNDWWEYTPQNITGIKENLPAGMTAVYDFENCSWKIDAGQSTEIVTVKVTDINGKTVLQTNTAQTGNYISMKAYATGVYFMQMESTAGIWREKFIVK